MRKIAFLLTAGATAFATATIADAQAGGSTAPTPPTGGVRAQDVAASNRQYDSDYNTLAERGVKVTDKSRTEGRKQASVTLATAADFKPKAEVRDIHGVPVGMIASSDGEVAADPDQVVVDTGDTKIGVPLTAFGKDDKGLLLSITAQKFRQLVAQAHSADPAQPGPSH